MMMNKLSEIFNKTAPYLENVIRRSSHLLFGSERDGAGWSRITQCVFRRRKAYGEQSLTAAPRNEHKIRRAHCSCLAREYESQPPHPNRDLDRE